MTDKERIEIYVNELPKRCIDCPCMNNDGYGGYDCNLYYKQHKKILGCEPYDDTIPNACPLKTIQSVQNQIAVEALEKVKELVNEKSVWSSPFGHQKIHASTVEQIIDQLIKEYGRDNENI